MLKVRRFKEIKIFKFRQYRKVFGEWRRKRNREYMMQNKNRIPSSWKRMKIPVFFGNSLNTNISRKK